MKKFSLHRKTGNSVLEPESRVLRNSSDGFKVRKYILEPFLHSKLYILKCSIQRQPVFLVTVQLRLQQKFIIRLFKGTNIEKLFGFSKQNLDNISLWIIFLWLSFSILTQLNIFGLRTCVYISNYCLRSTILYVYLLYIVSRAKKNVLYVLRGERKRKFVRE